jgi:hypothetical protein
MKKNKLKSMMIACLYYKYHDINDTAFDITYEYFEKNDKLLILIFEIRYLECLNVKQTINILSEEHNIHIDKSTIYRKEESFLKKLNDNIKECE